MVEDAEKLGGEEGEKGGEEEIDFCDKHSSIRRS
jgi:hypothetical protein